MVKTGNVQSDWCAKFFFNLKWNTGVKCVVLSKFTALIPGKMILKIMQRKS